MINYVFAISVFFAELSNLAALIFSLAYCYRDFNPKYLRTFPIYCLAVLVADIAGLLASGKKGYLLGNSIATDLPFKLFAIFELIYMAYFFSLLIKSDIAKKVTWGLCIIFVIAFIAALFYHGHYNPPSGASALIESIILLIPCFIYFRELFAMPYVFNLAKEPSFWIVSSFFFYFSMALPTMLFSAYFQMHALNDIYPSVYSVNNYAQAISNIILIKGFTCRIKK